MKTYAWLTDPHLDHLDPEHLAAFAEDTGRRDVQGLFITGDIAEADSLLPILDTLLHHAPYPIYFVLGNHDYYGDSIRGVRERVKAWAMERPRAYWMPMCGVVELSATTALVGHGGWADGRIGDFLKSSVALNDYRKISDLVGLTPEARLARLMDLGTEAATHLAPDLDAALARFERVIVLTHVPPFREACWYQGSNACNEWTPHFSCGAMGEVLRSAASRFPTRMIHVLCGHTHNEGVADIAPNLIVKTGAADYGRPRLLEAIQCTSS